MFIIEYPEMSRIDVPMSSEDITAQLPNAGVYLYRDLIRLKKLPPLPFILLYETEPSYGHWVAVHEVGGGIEHFDSYGYRPDAELSFIPEKYRKAFASTRPQLVRLLLEDGRPVSYSEFKLQRDPAQTCGRWCVTRILTANVPAAMFAKSVRRVAREMGVTPDDIVAAIVP